jgi:hypothetical protein
MPRSDDRRGRRRLRPLGPQVRPPGHELLFPGVVDVERLAAQDVCLPSRPEVPARPGPYLKRTASAGFVILKTADDGPGKPDPLLLDAIAKAGRRRSPQ